MFANGGISDEVMEMTETFLIWIVVMSIISSALYFDSKINQLQNTVDDIQRRIIGWHELDE